jgi:hypothetical protein
MRRKRGKRTDAKGRSIGESRHVRLYRWMMRSNAWQSLSLAARCLLVEMYDLYDGTNNGRLFMSARDAGRRLGVGKTKGWRALHELRDKGFIRPHHEGYFQVKVRHATTWVLSEFEFAGQVATKDFMRWRPPTEIETTVRPGEQPVPLDGQEGVGTQDHYSICPPRGTDSTQSAENLSASADTDKLPPGVG